MELKSLDQIKDEYFGVKGTPDRDRFERELEALCIGVQIRNARQKKEMKTLPDYNRRIPVLMCHISTSVPCTPRKKDLGQKKAVG